jgi:multicomponent Na+:H+ antiporter subunit A
MTRSVVVDTTARLVFHSALVLSLYLLVAGHNLPGGGFVGGLVAGAAVALVYVAGGVEEVRGLSRVRPWFILGAGLIVVVGTALVPLVTGGALLENGSAYVTLPVVGELKFTSALAFDAGVYVVVVGVVLMVFEAFGDEPEPEPVAAPPAGAEPEVSP